jgi:cytochrome o ubiquinol oxidase subunit III
MNEPTHIDTRDPVRDAERSNGTGKYVFGFWIYILSDCLLFASLFATFAVLQNNVAEGPMGGDIFSLPFVLLETLILLTSSFTAGLALIAMHENDKKQSLGWLTTTVVLGASFIALELYEFTRLILEGNGPHTSAFLSSFFTLVGTHGLHVTMGLIWMLVLIYQIYKKGFTPKIDRRFICLVLFWHFLDIVWIFIFSLVYLMQITA